MTIKIAHDDPVRLQNVLKQLCDTYIRWNTEAMNCVDFAHIIYLSFFTRATCLIYQSDFHTVCSVNGVLICPQSNAKIRHFEWRQGALPTDYKSEGIKIDTIDKSQPTFRLDLYFGLPAIRTYTLTKNYQ